MKSPYENVRRTIEEMLQEELDPEVATTEEIETALEQLPELVTKLKAAWELSR